MQLHVAFLLVGVRWLSVCAQPEGPPSPDKATLDQQQYAEQYRQYQDDHNKYSQYRNDEYQRQLINRHQLYYDQQQQQPVQLFPDLQSLIPPLTSVDQQQQDQQQQAQQQMLSIAQQGQQLLPKLDSLFRLPQEEQPSAMQMYYPTPDVINGQSMMQDCVPLNATNITTTTADPCKMECFSWDMKVRTEMGEVKLMRDLVVGDRVLTRYDTMLTYSPILMFMHKSHQIKADFVNLHLSDGSLLKLTEYHLIYVTDCDDIHAETEVVYAKNVKLGDCLYSVKNQRDREMNVFDVAKVMAIKMTEEQGVYAPLTGTGDIVVNDLLVSCHCNLQSRHLQHSVLYYANLILNLFTGLFSDNRNQADSSGPVLAMASLLDDVLPSKFFS